MTSLVADRLQFSVRKVGFRMVGHLTAMAVPETAVDGNDPISGQSKVVSVP